MRLNIDRLTNWNNLGKNITIEQNILKKTPNINKSWFDFKNNQKQWVWIKIMVIHRMADENNNNCSWNQWVLFQEQSVFSAAFFIAKSTIILINKFQCSLETLNKTIICHIELLGKEKSASNSYLARNQPFKFETKAIS